MSFVVSLICLIAGSVFVGVAAQRAKARTGAGWASLTFGVGLIWWLLFLVFLMLGGSEGVRFIDTWGRLEENKPIVAALIAGGVFAGIPTLLMMFLVGTLPERQSVRASPIQSSHSELQRDDDAKRRLPCPLCAEAILPTAKVCPHCRNELPTDWTARDSHSRSGSGVGPPIGVNSDPDIAPQNIIKVAVENVANWGGPDKGVMIPIAVLGFFAFMFVWLMWIL